MPECPCYLLHQQCPFSGLVLSFRTLSLCPVLWSDCLTNTLSVLLKSSVEERKEVGKGGQFLFATLLIYFLSCLPGFYFVIQSSLSLSLSSILASWLFFLLSHVSPSHSFRTRSLVGSSLWRISASGRWRSPGNL